MLMFYKLVDSGLRLDQEEGSCWKNRRQKSLPKYSIARMKSWAIAQPNLPSEIPSGKACVYSVQVSRSKESLECVWSESTGPPASS